MSERPKACPHCGARENEDSKAPARLQDGLSPFAEFGSFVAADDGYEMEGNLDGFRCGACGGHFFTAPPAWSATLDRLDRLIREDKRSCGACDGEGKVRQDGQLEKCDDCHGTGELEGRP